MINSLTLLGKTALALRTRTRANFSGEVRLAMDRTSRYDIPTPPLWGR